METMSPRKKTGFSLRLCTFRRSLKLTQAQFAESLGIATRTVIGWENGKQPGTHGIALLKLRYPKFK